ncbi:MAG: S-layer homology domain-containing protein [Cellulosilyticaceae bacterium]
MNVKSRSIRFLGTMQLCALFVTANVFAQTAPDFLVSANKQTLRKGETVKVTVEGRNIEDLYAYEVNMKIDASELTLTQSKSLVNGFTIKPKTENGIITFANTNIGDKKGESGNFAVAEFTFEAKDSDIRKISVENIKVLDSNLNEQNYPINKVIEIKGKTSTSGQVDPSPSKEQTTINEIVKKDTEKKEETKPITHKVFKDNVKAIAYIGGYEDHTFRPDAPIKRGEAVSMLCRLLATENVVPSYNYKDMEMWAKEPIAMITSMKYMSGYPDGTFKPNKVMTRGEFASVLSKILNLKVQGDTKLTDVKGHWAEKAICALNESGYIKGYEDGSFKPDKSITRAECVSIMNRIIGKTANKDEISETKFKDVPNTHWAFEQINIAVK